ncbi:MAG: transcription antitermination factor NusB [Novosphingobium sp.]
MSRVKGPARLPARSAARLAAVQALYQLEMEATPMTSLLDEFHMHRLGAEIEDDQYLEADVAFFDDVVRGVAARREEIDGRLADRLAQGWSIARLDRTMLQILRAGAYELLARPDISVSIVINEYLDVAHAFFDDREAKFVNGLLDAIARDVRED